MVVSVNLHTGPLAKMLLRDLHSGQGPFNLAKNNRAPITKGKNDQGLCSACMNTSKPPHAGTNYARGGNRRNNSSITLYGPARCDLHSWVLHSLWFRFVHFLKAKEIHFLLNYMASRSDPGQGPYFRLYEH